MTRFDYVIVGAGPAGCVLANRLSADPEVRVLLVEAGDTDTNPLIAMPGGFGQLLADPATAHYPTRPFGPQQQVDYWVRGKTLGGSSSVNRVVYTRGARADYDALERLGNPGWGWDEHAAGRGAAHPGALPLEQVSDHGGGQLRVEGELGAAGERDRLQVEFTVKHVDGGLELDAPATVDQRQLGMTWSPLASVPRRPSASTRACDASGDPRVPRRPSPGRSWADMGDADENGAKSYELAFEEAGRALDAQERAVNELRSRAGVLIAAAAITTSFFGSRAVVGDGLSGWAWVAVIAFMLVGGCVLMVLWPRSDWSFSASAADIIAEYIEPEPVEFRIVQRDLALHRSAAYDRNARQLGRLFLVFRVGLIVLVVEVAAWVVALAERG